MLIRHLITGTLTWILLMALTPYIVHIPQWTCFYEIQVIITISFVAYIIPISFLIDYICSDYGDDRLYASVIFTIIAGFAPTMFTCTDPFQTLYIFLVNLILNEFFRWIAINQKDTVEKSLVKTIYKRYGNRR